MRKQTVMTSLGEISVSPLSIAELRQLHELLALAKTSAGDLACVLKAVPLIIANVRKVHQHLTIEEMEAGLTIEDLSKLIAAVLDVSGMRTRYSPAPTPIGDTRKFH